MAKKITGYVKLQIPAGEATPAPPVGPALGQQGVNIMDFCKNFNARTASQKGLIIPVVITVFADRSYTFITKTPPEQGEGREGHEAAGRGDRENQAPRSERGGPAGGGPGRRRDREEYGYRGRLTNSWIGKSETGIEPVARTTR